MPNASALDYLTQTERQILGIKTIEPFDTPPFSISLYCVNGGFVYETYTHIKSPDGLVNKVVVSTYYNDGKSATSVWDTPVDGDVYKMVLEDKLSTFEYGRAGFIVTKGGVRVFSDIWNKWFGHKIQTVDGALLAQFKNRCKIDWNHIHNIWLRPEHYPNYSTRFVANVIAERGVLIIDEDVTTGWYYHQDSDDVPSHIRPFLNKSDAVLVMNLRHGFEDFVRDEWEEFFQRNFGTFRSPDMDTRLFSADIDWELIVRDLKLVAEKGECQQMKLIKRFGAATNTIEFSVPQ